jgi:hypothetical protein
LNRQLSSKWPQIHEKKFNILNCKGNANQNWFSSQNGHRQEIKQQVLGRLWGKDPGALLVGMWPTAPTIGISMDVPQKTKTQPSYDPAVPLLGT